MEKLMKEFGLVDSGSDDTIQRRPETRPETNPEAREDSGNTSTTEITPQESDGGTTEDPKAGDGSETVPDTPASTEASDCHPSPTDDAVTEASDAEDCQTHPNTTAPADALTSPRGTETTSGSGDLETPTEGATSPPTPVEGVCPTCHRPFDVTTGKPAIPAAGKGVTHTRAGANAEARNIPGAVVTPSHPPPARDEVRVTVPPACIRPNADIAHAPRMEFVTPPRHDISKRAAAAAKVDTGVQFEIAQQEIEPAYDGDGFGPPPALELFDAALEDQDSPPTLRAITRPVARFRGFEDPDNSLQTPLDPEQIVKKYPLRSGLRALRSHQMTRTRELGLPVRFPSEENEDIGDAKLLLVNDLEAEGGGESEGEENPPVMDDAFDIAEGFIEPQQNEEGAQDEEGQGSDQSDGSTPDDVSESDDDDTGDSVTVLRSEDGQEIAAPLPEPPHEEDELPNPIMDLSEYEGLSAEEAVRRLEEYMYSQRGYAAPPNDADEVTVLVVAEEEPSAEPSPATPSSPQIPDQLPAEPSTPPPANPTVSGGLAEPNTPASPSLPAAEGSPAEPRTPAPPSPPIAGGLPAEPRTPAPSSPPFSEEITPERRFLRTPRTPRTPISSNPFPPSPPLARTPPPRTPPLNAPSPSDEGGLTPTTIKRQPQQRVWVSPPGPLPAPTPSPTVSDAATPEIQEGVSAVRRRRSASSSEYPSMEASEPRTPTGDASTSPKPAGEANPIRPVPTSPQMEGEDSPIGYEPTSSDPVEEDCPDLFQPTSPKAVEKKKGEKEEKEEKAEIEDSPCKPQESQKKDDEDKDDFDSEGYKTPTPTRTFSGHPRRLGPAEGERPTRRARYAEESDAAEKAESGDPGAAAKSDAANPDTEESGSSKAELAAEKRKVTPSKQPDRPRDTSASPPKSSPPQDEEHREMRTTPRGTKSTQHAPRSSASRYKRANMPKKYVPVRFDEDGNATEVPMRFHEMRISPAVAPTDGPARPAAWKMTRVATPIPARRPAGAPTPTKPARPAAKGKASEAGRAGPAVEAWLERAPAAAARCGGAEVIRAAETVVYPARAGVGTELRTRRASRPRSRGRREDVGEDPENVIMDPRLLQALDRLAVRHRRKGEERKMGG